RPGADRLLSRRLLPIPPFAHEQEEDGENGGLAQGRREGWEGGGGRGGAPRRAVTGARSSRRQDSEREGRASSLRVRSCPPAASHPGLPARAPRRTGRPLPPRYPAHDQVRGGVSPKQG